MGRMLVTKFCASTPQESWRRSRVCDQIRPIDCRRNNRVMHNCTAGFKHHALSSEWYFWQFTCNLLRRNFVPLEVHASRITLIAFDVVVLLVFPTCGSMDARRILLRQVTATRPCSFSL